jgi:Flp pilus assembly protein TadG
MKFMLEVVELATLWNYRDMGFLLNPVNIARTISGNLMTRHNSFLERSSARAGGNIRSRRGTTIAEFGPTLMLAFAVLVFPMMAIGMLGLRYVLLLNATEMAAEAASKSQNFKTDTSQVVNGVTQYSYSAVTQANTVSQLGCKNIGNGSVQWVSTNTFIYSCPLGGTTLSTPGANLPLTAAANPTANTYNCVVVVVAKLQPVFPGAAGLLGSIQGFNAPITVTCQSSKYFESTTNLNN